MVTVVGQYYRKSTKLVRRPRCRFVLCYFLEVQIEKTVLLNMMQGGRFLPLQNVSFFNKDYFMLIGFIYLFFKLLLFFFIVVDFVIH